MFPKFPETPEEAIEMLRNQRLASVVQDMLIAQRQAFMVLVALKKSATPGSPLAGQVDDLERVMQAALHNQIEPLVEYAAADQSRLIKDA